MRADEQDEARLARRMAAVSSVRQVVGAVWALARAQLPQVERAAGEATVYLDWVDAVVTRLAGAPLPGRPGAALHVVLGPERPFCGALARQVLAQLPPAAPLVLVGQRLIEAADLQPELAAKVELRLRGAATHDEHEEVARAVAEAVLARAGARQVVLLHPAGGGPGLHRVVLLSGPREPLQRLPDTFSPLPLVLAAAVREAVAGRLAVGALEALRAEVRARIVATEAARHACDRRLEDLRQGLRVARQEQITSELIEVVAARAAALGV